MSAHRQSGQTETYDECAHGDNRSHRPLRSPRPFGPVADEAGNDAVPAANDMKDFTVR